MSEEKLAETLANLSISELSNRKEYQIMASDTVSLAEFNRLKNEMVIMSQKLSQHIRRKTPGSLEPVRIDKNPPPENASGLKPTPLPDFDGNRNNYAAWRTAVLDTFRMDWNIFGYDDDRAFLMIYKAMKGSALAKVGPFYERGGVDGTRKPEDFIEFLDKLNLDPTRVARANDELHALRMGERQRWPDFYAAWSNKLTEARGDSWDDANKISMLRNALNDRLITTLAGNHLLPEDDFDEWVRIVGHVAQQLEVLDGRNRRLKQPVQSEFSRWNSEKDKFKAPETSKQPLQNGLPRMGDEYRRVGELDSSGDTIMGGINVTGVEREKQQRGRAKWKTPERIEQLKRERKCFRCERKGCSLRVCPLLPARRPAEEVRINSATLPEIDPSLIEYDEPVAKCVVEKSEN